MLVGCEHLQELREARQNPAKMVGLLQDNDGDEAHEFFVEDPKILGQHRVGACFLSMSFSTRNPCDRFKQRDS